MEPVAQRALGGSRVGVPDEDEVLWVELPKQVCGGFLGNGLGGLNRVLWRGHVGVTRRCADPEQLCGGDSWALHDQHCVSTTDPGGPRPWVGVRVDWKGCQAPGALHEVELGLGMWVDRPIGGGPKLGEQGVCGVIAPLVSGDDGHM